MWGDLFCCCCCCSLYTTSRSPPHRLLTASSSSSTSPPPSASAGQPQKRWLDSREAPILQPRQSRLHRWVTMEHASRLPLPHFQGHFRLCSLVFGIVFFLSVCVCVCVRWFCYFWRRSCVHFSCKRGLFSSRACKTHTNTHKPRCQRAQEESHGVWSEPLRICFCFSSPLTSLILAPGVTYWTVSNSSNCISMHGLSEAKRSREDEPVFCFAPWSDKLGTHADEPADVRCVRNKTPCCYFEYQQLRKKMSHVKFTFPHVEITISRLN